MTTFKSFATAWFLVAAAGGTAAAQHGTTAAPSTTGMPMPAHSTMNKGSATDMMEHRQQMMADMRDADRKLDELVALMNAAQGQDRLDRVADIVKELVAARRQMADGMMMMMPSGSTPMSPMMTGCPMMKQTIEKEEKDGAADDHSANHPVQK